MRIETTVSAKYRLSAKRMQNQLRLQSNGNSRDLVECPLSYEEYVKLLRDAGVIE
jgi:hypothetical protein